MTLKRLAQIARDKDLFQTTTIDKSSLGAFTSFVVFPVVTAIYIIQLQYSEFNKIQSTTTLVATGACTNISAECISKYGCAVGQYTRIMDNGNSFAKVSRDSGTSNDAIETFYNYGQKFQLTLCPGFDSFVDIAPRTGFCLKRRYRF